MNFDINIEYIIRPLIGAVIGYVTNWIAIKMMFRPTKAIKIFGIRLPFTPGIIPKNKERLAKSVGTTISNNLLNNAEIEKYLLSDDMKESLSAKIQNMIFEYKAANYTLEELTLEYIKEENYNKAKNKLEEKLTQNIYNKIIELNLGKIIAAQFKEAAEENVKSSIIGVLGGNSLVNGISTSVESKINDYIKDNGEEYLKNVINNEINKYTSMNLTEMIEKADSHNIDLTNVMMKSYEKIIIEKLPDVLRNVEIATIVTNKITEMEPLELERLILKIMKKELNALVNLGALIGLVLGLLNLLI